MSTRGTFHCPPGGAIIPSQVYQPLVLCVIRLVCSPVPLSEDCWQRTNLECDLRPAGLAPVPCSTLATPFAQYGLIIVIIDDPKVKQGILFPGEESQISPIPKASNTPLKGHLYTSFLQFTKKESELYFSPFPRE